MASTVAGAFGWHDVGDYTTLADLLGETDGAGNAVVDESKGPSGKAQVLLSATHDVVVVPRSGRLIATHGVSELVIVDTDDALLICRRDQVQDIKQLVDRLRAEGVDHLV